MKKYLVCFVLLSFVALAQEVIDTHASLPVEERVADLLKRMTLEEKLDMLSGTGFETKPLQRLGIPSLKMTDGPVGVRWDAAVAFPASIMLAATFDTALAERYGRALAIETKAKGRNTILGPCVNINRVPHGGRNFESFGEDPFLASRMAVSYIRGVQNEGVVTTVKHFAVNNQETDRMFVNAVVDKRTLYEIYFPAFKAAVQEAKSDAVMCAYNKLNGPYCSENEMLLNTVLKDEWKFDGLVMSDWGAVHSTQGAATYGLDLEMPGGDFLTKDKLMPLVTSGAVKISVIDDKIRRMLRVMFRRGLFDRTLDVPPAHAPEQRATALDVARAGIVLVKNEGKLLPLDPSAVRSIAVIGPNAEVLRTGGGGSSMVKPAFVQSPLEGVKQFFPGASVTFAVGARQRGDVPPIDPEYFFVPGDTTGKNGLSAEYFNNKELSGEPVLRRVDRTIDFRWGGNGPADGIGKDNFSVRWKSVLRPKLSGTYEITAASDDGIRVWLDGRMIIDHWSDHAVDARSATVSLEAGVSYSLTVEFYENGGDAAAMLGWTKPNEDALAEAVEAAKKSMVAFLFIGNSHFQESEGFDRQEIDLPADQLKLIDAVSAVNPRTIVVLHAGAQVNVVPWIHRVSGLLWAFFPGQEGTQAVMEVITGKQNPSGKLPFTVAQRWEDYPSYDNFPGKDSAVHYAEGIMVGYRHFLTKNIMPAIPFGFGLSYTTFKLSDLKVLPAQKGHQRISVTVTNTGSVAGAEVVQVYVKDKKPALIRPEKELKAFAKVMLKPGEKRTIILDLPKSSFEYYTDTDGKWIRSNGGYVLSVGTSATETPLSVSIK